MSPPDTKAKAETELQRVHKRKFAANKPRFIDVNEVCYRTGMGKSTIWKKVADDEFVQPYRIKNGVTRWLESDIDKWVEDIVTQGREAQA